jgi:TetR/AcrR family transcriptional regulator, regulator of cefoperazone and chloramphenicol sensitivity
MPAATDASPRGDATRSALIGAAMTVFGRDGFHAASTRAIAELAGVRQALIGYHFRNKEGLYLAVFEHIVGRLRQRLDPLLDALETALVTPPTADRAEVRALHLELLLRVVDGALDILVGADSAKWVQLIVREQAEPSEAFAFFYDGFVRRASSLLARLILSIRGRDDEMDARLTVISILGQMVVFRVLRAGVLLQLGWTSIAEAELGVIRRHVRKTITAQLLHRTARGSPLAANASGAAAVAFRAGEARRRKR